MEQETTKDTQERLIEQLEILNKRTEKLNTKKVIFVTGVIYGVGFFIGSAILATIALGILGPWFGQIEWVRENFERGESLKQASVEAIL